MDFDVGFKSCSPQATRLFWSDLGGLKFWLSLTCGFRGQSAVIRIWPGLLYKLIVTVGFVERLKGKSHSLKNSLVLVGSVGLGEFFSQSFLHN